MLEHHVLTPSCCAHRWNHNSLPTAGPSAACSPSPPTPASMLRSLTSLSPFPHSSTRRPWRYPVITPNDCMRAWVWQWLRGHSWDIPFQLKVNVNPPHSISLYNKGRRLWWTTVPFLFQIFFFLYDDYVRQTKWTGLLFWVDELSFAVWYERKALDDASWGTVNACSQLPSCEHTAMHSQHASGSLWVYIYIWLLWCARFIWIDYGVCLGHMCTYVCVAMHESVRWLCCS